MRFDMTLPPFQHTRKLSVHTPRDYVLKSRGHMRTHADDTARRKQKKPPEIGSF